MILDDAQHDAQTEPRASPTIAGGKERVKYFRLYILGNPGDRVTDTDQKLAIVQCRISRSPALHRRPPVPH